jgi:hypothetical protein
MLTIPAGQDPQVPMVPALTAMTAPLSNDKAEAVKYYVCSMPTASLHRPDGKKITFINGFFKAELLEDQKYLDRQIETGAFAGGGVEVKHASQEQVDDWRMRTDPRGTIRSQVKQELKSDPALRAEIEAQIRAELAGQKEPGSVEAANLDGAKLASTKTAAEVIAERLGKEVVKSGSGTVVVDKPLMESQAAPIKPVSTADLGGATPPSGK